jgi:glycerol-3-phosphate dehydrogenase (NAD(P)+)
MNVMVLGSGGWGTALAMVLHSNGHQVTMWTYLEEECQHLLQYRGNEKLLPGVHIPEEIAITTDMTLAAGQDMVVMAVPSFAVSSTAEKLAQILDAGTIVVNVAKGLDSFHNYCRFSESIDRALQGRNLIVALTGPTHAEEVARGIPTTILAASKDLEAAQSVQDMFMSKRFRVYISPDIVGAELGGAFKNIIALAAGFLDGMGLGDNTKAALMTRGLAEMVRLGVSLGARKETFAGLSGIGDLIVTCTSMHSRNRRAGILVGQGKTIEEAMKEVGAVVEGYYATKAGYMLAQKMGVEMPITTAMYQALYEGADPETLIQQLMTRSKKAEFEELW